MFEVEDAEGPLEGAEQGSIAARFGRLKVAEAGSIVLPEDELAQLAQLAAAQQQLAAEAISIDADLELWRQHLGIAPAPGRSVGDSGQAPTHAEAGSAEPADAAMQPGSDAKEQDDNGVGGDEVEDEEGDAACWLEDPPEGFGRQLSQFGRLFSALDGWTTDATLRHVRRPPASSSGQPDDVPPPEFPQVMPRIHGNMGF